jgi:hypothetical protein
VTVTDSNTGGTDTESATAGTVIINGTAQEVQTFSANVTGAEADATLMYPGPAPPIPPRCSAPISS